MSEPQRLCYNHGYNKTGDRAQWFGWFLDLASGDICL